MSGSLLLSLPDSLVFKTYSAGQTCKYRKTYHIWEQRMFSSSYGLIHFLVGSGFSALSILWINAFKSTVGSFFILFSSTLYVCDILDSPSKTLVHVISPTPMYFSENRRAEMNESTWEGGKAVGLGLVIITPRTVGQLSRQPTSYSCRIFGNFSSSNKGWKNYPGSQTF